MKQKISKIKYIFKMYDNLEDMETSEALDMIREEVSK
tara:strand:+ start:334 stop:444 length:111 start_codon:yes stop_codon:yes gene_type:complete